MGSEPLAPAAADAGCDGIAARFAQIATALSAAAAAGARMLVMPELFLPGYNRPDLHGKLAQPLDGGWCRRLSELTAQTGCGLTIGWAERAGEQVFNAASCFGPDGRLLAHYRKIQLFGPMEQAGFSAGDSYCLFDFEGQRAALLICYDVEFAPHIRAVAERGAELILVPTANPAGYENVSRLLVPARAAEMGLTIAYANFCGSEAGLDYGGLSVIAGPDGEALAAAGRGEVLLVADLAVNRTVPAERLASQKRDLRRVSDKTDEERAVTK